MSDKLTWGLIGCGRMGRLHLDTVQGHPGLKVHTFFDVNSKQAEAFKNLAPSAIVAPTFGAFLANKPDFVTVATHATDHAASVIKCAQAGVKIILCEKPLAIDLEQADAMIQACEKSGTILAVNNQMHFSSIVAKAKAALENGVIGELLTVRAHDKDGRVAGDSLTEIGPHLFDLLILFAGKPAWVFSTIQSKGKLATREDVIDSAKSGRSNGPILGDKIQATFGFDTGLTAEFTALSRPAGASNMGIDLIGSKGALILRPWDDESLYVAQDPWRPYHRLKALGTSKFSRFLKNLTERGDVSGEKRMQTFHIPLMRRVYDDVTTALSQRKQPSVSGSNARLTLEMIQGIWQSHLEGRRIPLPLNNRKHPLELK